MNVCNTTVLTRELKPLEAPFLSTNDPPFLRLKYQMLIYFYKVFSCAHKDSYALAERFRKIH